MEWIRLTLGALLLSLSLPSLPAQDNVTANVAAPITEVVTMAVSTPEATIETTPVPVVVTKAQPASGIITPATAIPKVTSVQVHISDAITTVITNPETITVQESTSDAPTTTSEAETMSPSPVITEGSIDTTTPPGPKPTLSQEVLTTASYLTTSQNTLTFVITVWPLHTTLRPMEDSTPTPEPPPASEINVSHTEEVTTAPTPPSVNATPGHASTPATTHTSTDTDSTVAGVRVEAGQPSLLWAIIVVLMLGVICMGTVYCVCLVIRRKRQSHTEYFVPSFQNGKSSKRKKGEVEDAWAGPVMLRGGDREEGEGREEGGSPEDNKREAAGTNVLLSTFIANETEGERGGPDGGIGVAGSKEAEKWEEKEPLLYIDEGVEEGLERMAPPSLSKSNSEKKTLGGNGEGESEKEMERGEGNVKKENESERGEQNGGAAFCLITAV